MPWSSSFILFIIVDAVELSLAGWLCDSYDKYLFLRSLDLMMVVVLIPAS